MPTSRSLRRLAGLSSIMSDSFHIGETRKDVTNFCVDRTFHVILFINYRWLSSHQFDQGQTMLEFLFKKTFAARRRCPAA